MSEGLATPHGVLIAGGSGAGLGFASSLGKKVGRKGLAEMTRLDVAHTRLGKPLLHEIAAGTLDAQEEVEFLDGLVTDRLNQVVVYPMLKATRDDNIFAVGDCAACPWPGHESTVPPRAQAAHRQASLLCKSVSRRLQWRPALRYFYHDYVLLVSPGTYSTVGNLMGNLPGEVTAGGIISRMVYLLLYKMPQIVLYGAFRTSMLALSNIFGWQRAITH